MRNKKYDLSKPLPRAVRRETYKRALDYLKGLREADWGQGLCIILPCALWGLDCWSVENAPNGEYWDYRHTPNAFPELAGEWIDKVRKAVTEGEDKNRMRIEFLEQAIEKTA